MSNVVDLQFRYSEQEYTEAAKIYLHKTFHTRFNIAVALIVIGLGVASWAFNVDETIGYLFTFLGLILLALSCYNYFILPKRWYARNPTLHEEYQLQFSDEGIIFRSKDIDSTLKWSLYKNVWETEQFYFLLYGKDAFSLIPKRAFANAGQERAFKLMLEKHVALNSAGAKSLEPVKENEQEYVPKSLEPPDWR